MAIQLVIAGSVGAGGQNLQNDVRVIQDALNHIPTGDGGPLPPLDIDGFTGPKTNGAISRFQSHHFGWADGRVDTDQVTIAKLREVLNNVSPAKRPIIFGLAAGATPNLGNLVPIPVTTPVTPTVLGSFEIDLFGWIPQPEVDNPLSLLPGAIKSLLPSGMCDPFFGGDNFGTPASSPTAMTTSGKTFRATQHLDFTIPKWGDAPKIGVKKTSPGVTTCLDNRRASAGKETFRLTATVKTSVASVSFSSLLDCYEVKLSGMVLDPVPTAAAAALTAKIPHLSSLPSFISAKILDTIKELTDKATPSLTWDATLRIQRGGAINPAFQLLYMGFAGSETSGSMAGAKTSIGTGSNLAHGNITFSMWPSAVIYLSHTPGGGTKETQPIFFSSGLGRPKPETAFIVVPKPCKLRQLTW